MELETLQLETRDGVATLTLNRPDKYHAVNMQMHADFRAAFRQIAKDREARAVVLAATGKAFCSGQDLNEFAMVGDDFRIDEHVRQTFNRLVMTMRQLPKPIICAVNGVAAGAGASLALAADLRVCSDTATFTQAFIKIGLIPDTGGTWFLPHLVGISTALDLAWSGRSIGAEEALRIGLVNEVVPADQLAQHVHAKAAELAQLPTRAIALTKRAMYRAITTSLEDSLEYEAQLQQSAAQSADHQEGVSAFLEKRAPAFSGR